MTFDSQKGFGYQYEVIAQSQESFAAEKESKYLLDQGKDNIIAQVIKVNLRTIEERHRTVQSMGV